MIRAILSLLVVQWIQWPGPTAASCSADENYALLQTKGVPLNENITEDIETPVEFQLGERNFLARIQKSLETYLHVSPW